MQNAATARALSEPQFAALVDACAADPARHGQLLELLHEDHPAYDQCGTSNTVRMRGWVLLALARVGVSEDALLFVLEELDTGTDAYLVAAAARALRSYANPAATLAPFVMRGLTNIRYHDEPVSFEGYGEYAVGSGGTSPVQELLATMEWLGPHAQGVLPDLEPLGQPGGLPKKLLPHLNRALESIRGKPGAESPADSCCGLPGLSKAFFGWAPGARRGSEAVESIAFEDQDGAKLRFQDFFRGQPSIVVFFYTRCDNPLKCSLTITKLARIRQLLEARGLAGKIRTAAITYDPGYDLPERLRRYGEARGVRTDAGHKLLRAVGGIQALRSHFQLGVNFIESLVNRHRIELYILDAGGRIAATFERIHWEEPAVVERATEVLKEVNDTPAQGPKASAISGTLASLAVAFFPKCPVCWAAYLSVFGIAGIEKMPWFPALQPVLALLMLINVASVWLRGRATGKMLGTYLVFAGALAIGAARLGTAWEGIAMAGVLLTLVGSLVSAVNSKRERRA